MKTTLIVAAFAAVLAGPASAATDADIVELRQALETVNRRLDALEERNRALETRNEQLEERNAKLEEASDRPAAAQNAQARPGSGSADWATKITWHGDLRYRHESLDIEEQANDQIRHRIRARFGMTARINEALTGTVQLATNGGTNDPRSTMQTIGSGFERKGVALDLANIDWKFAEGSNLVLGKMPQPFQKVPTYFWDSDLTPEGGALRLARGVFFASAYGWWLQESGTNSDANVVGAQLGIRQKFSDGFTLTAAAHYYDIGAVQGEITTASTTPACVPNNAFFLGSQGNSTQTFAGCARLLSDFNIIEALAQVDLTVGSLPLALFASAAQNTEADEFDTAIAGGFTLGRASAPGSWEIGYVYQKVEKDALFGQFVDSDFGGGITDTRGSVLRVGWAPASNWVLNGTYYLNDRFNDVPIDVGGEPETDLGYDRWQLDFNVKF
jgi:hypothetical protein